MIRLVTYVAAAVAVVAIVAGCGGGGCTNCVAVTPCVTPAGMLASLSYPLPGATAVPGNISQVIVATNSTLPSDWQAGAGWDVLLAYPFSSAYSNGHYGAEFTAATAPYPTPTATPSFAGPQYWSSTISYVNAPNLPPGTQITVELNDANSYCFPGVTIGTFTTQ